MNHEYKYSFRNQFRTMASLSVYRTGHQQCSANYSRGMEVRDFYLIHFVIAGKGRYSLNGRVFPVSKGDAFLIYPSMPINYWADSEEPWEFCWVGFNGNDARLLMNATLFSPQTPVITTGDPEQMEHLMLGIHEHRGYELQHCISMTAQLYTLLAFLIEQAQSTALPVSHSGIEHVQRACDYIARHYGQPLTIHEIASYVNICRSHLYRVFLRHISLSPMQYLTEFRIREACNLMRKQPARIKEVAYAVGFQDSLYFSTIFKRLTGKTPRQYIQSMNDEPFAPIVSEHVLSQDKNL